MALGMCASSASRPPRRQSRRGAGTRPRAAGGSPAAAAVDLAPLPQTASEMVAACARAVTQGPQRQSLELLLPVNCRRQDFNNTEQLDYGDAPIEVYRTALDVAVALVSALAPGQEVSSKRIDDDDTPCAACYTADRKVVAVVLPTAERLPQIRELAEKYPESQLLIINKQWNDKGQVISDFGFGPWRKRAMDFLATFPLVFSLEERRIGAASTLDPATNDYMGIGGVARVLKVGENGPWEVFAMGGDGSSECIRVVEDAEPPTYQYLESVFTKKEYSLLAKRQVGPSSEERLLMEAVAGDVSSADWALKSAAEVAAAVGAGKLTDADINRLEAPALRAALAVFGVPTSGKVAALRERLKECVAAM